MSANASPQPTVPETMPAARSLTLGLKPAEKDDCKGRCYPITEGEPISPAVTGSVAGPPLTRLKRPRKCLAAASFSTSSTSGNEPTQAGVGCNNFPLTRFQKMIYKMLSSHKCIRRHSRKPANSMEKADDWHIK